MRRTCWRCHRAPQRGLTLGMGMDVQNHSLDSRTRGRTGAAPGPHRTEKGLKSKPNMGHGRIISCSPFCREAPLPRVAHFEP